MTTELEAVAQVVRGRAWAASGRGKRARVQTRLPLAAVAKLCGVHPPTLLRWEQGAALPNGEHAARYADVIEQLEEMIYEREEASHS